MSVKKPWLRPQLIVLERGAPEEGVLQCCKDGVMGGPEVFDGNCEFKDKDSITGLPCCGYCRCNTPGS